MEDPISYDLHGVSVLTILDLPSELSKDTMGWAGNEGTTDELPETLQHMAAHSADAFPRSISPMAGVCAAIGVVNGVAAEFKQAGR